MNNLGKGVWKEGMYITAKDYGYTYLDAYPNTQISALEAQIYNHLMEFDGYQKYRTLVDRTASKAAERVWMQRRGSLSTREE